MKAMVIRNYGGPEVFEMADVKQPEVKPGYVSKKIILIYILDLYIE